MAWDGGPERIIGLCAERLRTRLPGLLAKQRTRLHLSTAVLPDLVIHADWPPAEVGIDQMPSVWLSEVQTSATIGPWRSKPESVENVVTWRYVLGADVYLRDVSAGALAAARRRYVLAVRTCLLYEPGLYDSEARKETTYYSATIRSELWQERYSNIGTTPTQAVVGGFTVQFQADCEEQLDTWVQPTGPAADVVADVALIPFDVPIPGPP